MSNTTLVRLGGLAGIVGGALLIMSELLYFVVDPSLPAETVTSASFQFQALILLLGSVLLAGALIAIYAAR
ncbi:hypothetical protein BH23ACT11_BH23ACT11_02850 [soil metagenome]